MSSGVCVSAEPDAFEFDSDDLAETRPGAARMTDDQMLLVARECPATAIRVRDADGKVVA
jgi:ferredoxin